MSSFPLKSVRFSQLVPLDTRAPESSDEDTPRTKERNEFSVPSALVNRNFRQSIDQMT